MKPVYGEFCTVSGACGVGVVFEFTDKPSYNSWGSTYNRKEVTFGTSGGCGYLSAGFIKDDPLCDDAFAQLSEKYNVVFVSECRKNVNSGNMFYFAVFDCEGTGVPIGFNEFENDVVEQDDEEEF